jgi:hypothetical protein
MMRTKMRTARRAARMFVLFKGTREPLLLGRWSSRASACAKETHGGMRRGKRRVKRLVKRREKIREKKGTRTPEMMKIG